MICIPVGGMVVHYHLESHSLDIDCNTLHRAGKPMLRARAQYPRVISLITVALPIIPNLGTRSGKIVENKTTLCVETQLAVSCVDAWQRWEDDVTRRWIGAENERARTLRGRVERELEGARGTAAEEVWKPGCKCWGGCCLDGAGDVGG
jgi:hypothetical protein